MFVGFGFDLRYFLKTTSQGMVHQYPKSEGSFYYKDGDAKNNLINIPVQLNLGYEFKLSNPTLQYIGLWFSPGFSFDIDCGYRNASGDTEDTDTTFFTISFSWEAYMNMIFKNGMLLNIGVGGNKSREKALKGNDYYYESVGNYWHLDHTFLMIGTGVIF